MSKIYSEKLKDPRWQKRRLKIFERDDFKCQKCFETTETLHVHHVYYINGREPWEYPDFALITLCKGCHRNTSDPSNWRNEDTGEFSPAEWEMVMDIFGSGRGSLCCFNAFFAIGTTGHRLGFSSTDTLRRVIALLDRGWLDHLLTTLPPSVGIK